MSAAVAALRRPANWLQFARFAAVGASGYVVNLAVFAAMLHVGTGHRPAAVAAFVVALANNFTWNRRWTFAASGDARAQAVRFVAVSLGAFAVSLSALDAGIALGLHPLAAQTLAIGIATPVNFLGNRLWAFVR
jgi:dolichol-phosphate mannosyltransferase